MKNSNLPSIFALPHFLTYFLEKGIEFLMIKFHFFQFQNNKDDTMHAAALCTHFHLRENYRLQYMCIEDIPRTQFQLGRNHRVGKFNTRKLSYTLSFRRK